MQLVENDRSDLPLSGEPLYARLAEHYRRVIAAGTLVPGDRMPSIRALMQRHRVSLSTAMQACRNLEDAGWLQARPRAGYFVRQASSKLAGVHEPEIAAPPQARLVGLHERISHTLMRAREFPGAMDLAGSASAAPDLYPAAQLQTLALRILRVRPTVLTQAGEVTGLPEFRQEAARRMLRFGATIAPEEMLVTTGAVEGLNLALRAVAQPGDIVAIESPAFYGLLQILESLGLRALEIPTSPTTGLSIEALEMALSAYENVKAVVVVPTVQNPLGCTMPDERKAALVRLCAARSIAVIEDDPYSELVDDPAQARPLKAWDAEGGVIYCNTLTKSLAPGIRLGWLAAGRWHERVMMLKFAQNRYNDALPQTIAAEFIGSGAFDRHLHRLRERLRAQREAMAEGVARHFPAGTRLSPPAAGMLLWVALPEGVSSDALFEQALTQGIRIAPGSIFSNAGRFDAFVRLGCTLPFDREMERAIAQLGRLAGAPA